MLGSYGPSPDGKPYTKTFDPDTSPSGILARSGAYNVKSVVLDDDGEKYAGKCRIIVSPAAEHEYRLQSGHGPSNSQRSGKCPSQLSVTSHGCIMFVLVYRVFLVYVSFHFQ